MMIIINKIKYYLIIFSSFLLIKKALLDQKSPDTITFDPSLNSANNGFTGYLYSSTIWLNLNTASPLELIIYIINIVMTIVGLGCVILVIYAGFLWMTARGNEEQIEKSKKILIQGVIGLAIVMLSVSISYIVYAIIINSTTVIS